MGAAILEAFAAAGAVCVVNYFDDPDGHNRRDAEETAGASAPCNAGRPRDRSATSAATNRSSA